MDKKNMYLNEENYERGKKVLKTISLVILVVGFLLGGSLIVTGIVKTNELKEQNKQAIQQVEESNESRTASEVQSDIDSLQSQIDALETEISNLKIEQNKIFRDDRGFSDRYYEKQSQIELKEKELSKLRTQFSAYQSELWKINSGYNNTKKEIEKSKNVISTSKYVPFYIFGAFIIIVSCMISGSIFIFTKRREIFAFTAQQVMPVAQEGIEKVAPTVGKVGASIAKEMAPVYGMTAKEIAKGIKEGLKESEDEEEK